MNPLTGLEVADPSLLKIPVVLISISHFPATARPQAGLSFAPFVYELYITEGATRFLAAFYGEWPRVETPVSGGCVPRVGPIPKSGFLLGNRVWFDANSDGRQDPGEGGIAGLCVNLYDSAGTLVAQTTTDTNGFYGFNVGASNYIVEFVRPAYLEFTTEHSGEPKADSDADPATGRAEIAVVRDDLSVDAGLVPSKQTAPPSGDNLDAPLAQVGPIRSGRLLYRYIANSFRHSCLIFAYASPEVLKRLPECKVVFHQILGGGYMLNLSELWSVAKANQRGSGRDFDYSAYSFSELPAPESVPASGLREYIAYQNQSGWYYDAPSQSYLRYVDTSDYAQAGILHPDSDRLTGRQIAVQNLIVLFARHDVVSPTNLDIRLDQGKSGKAILLRDGTAQNIDWSMPKSNGSPIRFLQKNGEPALLRPGHTWVIIVTQETSVEPAPDGILQLNFVPPEGAK